MKRIATFAAVAALLLLAAPAFAAAPGDVIRSPLTDPYLLSGQTTRMVFPDRLTVETWGSPAAREVETSALSQWLLAGALPVREGSRLVKFGTDPQVYAVGPQGTLHWIKSESIASALYGKDWNRRVVTLFTSFFPHYRLGSAVETPVHPDGTLLKYASDPTVYYMINGVARPFANERAFRENRFSFDSVVTVSTPIAYVKGNPVNVREEDLNLLPARR
ncbi:MAG TPA: hypothetical protein VJ694_02325 [Patescibacteria group bacterium]|nr:hypothetical protein [Patescibacteria group bacterium]